MPQKPDEALLLGTSDGGLTWRLTESGDSEELVTSMWVTEGDRTLFAGGMGGPPVYPGDLVNHYWGSERGVLVVILRVRAHEVGSLSLGWGGRDQPLALTPSQLVPGIAIAALAVTPFRGPPERVVAMDALGAVLGEATFPYPRSLR